MTMLLLTTQHSDVTWRKAFEDLLPDVEFRTWPDAGDPADITMVLAWKAPEGTLAGFANAGAIVSLGHGVDHLLARPDLPDGVPIIRMVDESMKRQMPAFVLAAALHHHCRFDEYAVLQRESRWQPLQTRDPLDTTVGILGLGALGAETARHFAALGFPVVGWSRSQKEIAGVECFAGRETLSDFLGHCDILACLLPLTDDTHGILDAAAFARLKPGAYVINTARGGHIVEPDLLAALDSGHISGATLDVVGTEPLPTDHPFWRHPKVVITPHTSAITFAHSCAPQIVDNYHRLKDGRPLINQVDRIRGY